MKLLIFSDSHGRAENMERAVKENRADCLVFLGDGCREFIRLADSHALAHIEVAGNNDFMPQIPTYRTAEFGGVKIFLCHGHTFGVGLGLERLASAARAAGASVAFYGHTHRPGHDFIGGVHVINPGTAGSPRGCPCSYGVFTVEAGAFGYETRLFGR